MAFFDCIVGGSGKGNTLVVTCADDLAGATITCTNGTKTYTKTCPSTAPYEVTFYGLEAGTWTVSATVSGNTYTTTVVIIDYEAELGGFNWKTWVDLSDNYTSSDFTDLDDLLSDETAIRELMTIHACVDYLAGIATESADVETIIGTDLCAKWINLRDYALDTLYANEIIADYMDEADKYFYGEWALMPQVPTMTSNTAPYGEASADSVYSTNYAYLAFDGIESGDHPSWISNKTKANANQAYIQYKFVKPVAINNITITWSEWWDSCTFEILASNDDFVTSDNLGQFTGNNTQKISVNPNKNSYNAYRLQLISQIGDLSYAGNIISLQFYAWAPKGNVPVMTANSAPYGTASATTIASSSFQAYQAFDNNPSTAWSAGSTANAILSYQFTNPVCVKKVFFDTGKDSSYSASAKTWDILAKNSASDSWEVIYSGSNDDVKLVEQEIDNDEYYLYWGIKLKTSYRSNSFALLTLQFYGRELSVSIPVMTSTNVDPYGVASASGILNDNNAEFGPWLAFNRGNGDWQSTWEVATAWLQYKFPNKMVPVKAMIKAPTVPDGTFAWTTLKGSFQVSNDGENFVDILSFEKTQSGETYYDIPNTEMAEYQYFRLNITQGNMSGQGYRAVLEEVQFYGKDYSEKEFEAGTTKKWLYDHGVELEPITVGAQCVKENTQIVCNGYIQDYSSRSAVNFNAFDLTPFNMIRGVLGNKHIGVFALIVSNQDNFQWDSSTWLANIQITPPDTDLNRLCLDISSINASKKIYLGCGAETGRQGSFKELWLE